MKALVYRGPGKRSFEDRPRPAIKVPTDAIVRVTNATICGSDLRAMRDDAPRIARGRILGNEGTGIIERVGGGVSCFHLGDRVLISCVTSCGTCAQCTQGRPTHCQHGGWMLGSGIDGTCADYVRVPFADHSLISAGGTGDYDTDGPWIDHLPDGFRHNVLHGPDECTDTDPIVFGGSVGMEPLLAVMQYYRTVVRPALHIDRNRHPAARTRDPRTSEHHSEHTPQHDFEPTNKR